MAEENPIEEFIEGVEDLWSEFMNMDITDVKVEPFKVKDHVVINVTHIPNLKEYVNSLEIVDNPETNGKYTFFKCEDKVFYASMADLGRFTCHMQKGEDTAYLYMLETMGGRYEVMIFKCDDDFNVESMRDLYCKRSHTMSDDFLWECIKDFAMEYCKKK